jgi:lytic murein transglycosylase
VNIDRGQRVFTQTFLEFSDRMAAAYRIQRGGALIKTHAPVFARIDQQFGVPAPVIVAFWALESDFGANMGNYRTLSAIASLAYDCRRADRFRPQLLDALQLIQRGDLRPQEMIGSWAGELGQTRMMPSEYYRYAVDYDGDGARNLLRSVPDVLASTANYLAGLGWRRGEPWLTEVRVPANMPWQQADLDIKLPRSKWAAYGVTKTSAFICSGTTHWSIRPRPLISRPGSPVHRHFDAAIHRRRWLSTTSRRCRLCCRVRATTSAKSTAFSA